VPTPCGNSAKTDWFGISNINTSNKTSLNSYLCAIFCRKTTKTKNETNKTMVTRYHIDINKIEAKFYDILQSNGTCIGRYYVYIVVT